MKNLIYVLNKNGTPLMPTTRSGHIRKLLKCGKARIVEYNPFTIQLLYESTNYTSDLMVAIDPGRTNIGVNVINEENLCSLLNVKVSTRNKEIPKLMKERKCIAIIHVVGKENVVKDEQRQMIQSLRNVKITMVFI